MREIKKKSPAITLIPAIKCCLSNSYLIFLKTQNYHWHVTGPHFHALHLLFESQYKELFEANDVIAEHLRALNEFAPATLSEFKADSMIKEGVSSDGWRDMVKVLFSDHEQLIMLYNEALVLAEDDGDAASADLITDRLRAHKKHAWMLKSTLD